MQIELLSKSNPTVCDFLREKSKFCLLKNWCESLQASSNCINWKKIYENNYFSTIETKLRSFQMKLNLHSQETSIEPAGVYY